jgi:lysophospholipase L1-like esterase
VGPKPLEFSFIACSGARTAQIYLSREETGEGRSNKPPESQASRLEGFDPDMVTLAIGGNDAGFVKLLDKVSF